MPLQRKEEDDVAVLFPESTLRGREKTVLYRMFMAYGNGHGLLSATGDYGVVFGGCGEFYQKGTRRSKFYAVLCRGGDTFDWRCAGCQASEASS